MLLSAALSANHAVADTPSRLDLRHRELTLVGHLEGASTYGPFYPVGGAGFDRTCVGQGCDERSVVVVLPEGATARLDWRVEAPATGPGVTLRIFDERGDEVSGISGGSIDTPSPTTATYGKVHPLRAGRYTVRVSLMAGVTDYAAHLRLFVV
jgi:hypothetical protein